MKQKIFAVLAFISFFFFIGSVGAVDAETVPFMAGALRAAGSLAAMALFTWLAGGFRDYE